MVRKWVKRIDGIRQRYHFGSRRSRDIDIPTKRDIEDAKKYLMRYGNKSYEDARGRVYALAFAGNKMKVKAMAEKYRTRSE